MSPSSTPIDNASIGELMTRLTAQTSQLVRDEIRLAQREVQDSARHAGMGAGLFSVAGMLAAFGLATVIAAAVAGLSVVLPVWAAALIIGAALLLAGGIAGLLGKRQLQDASPVPEQTVANVKEDIREVKEAS
jgi:Flp pilus assembly protein TadB